MEYLNLRTMEKVTGLRPVTPEPEVSKLLDSTVQKPEYTMSQEHNVDAPENVILQTKNYEIFKFDPLNRAIRQDKVDHLRESIQTKNLLHLFPIVVTRSYVVIDGQHRLKVAETLDIPIYYIVSSQMVIEDAARVSANTDGWNAHDYLVHWCRLGLPDYLAIRDFWETKKWLSLSRAMSLCYRGQLGSDRKISLLGMFQDGMYKANNMEQAERVCTMALNFSSWVPFWRESHFLSALRNLDSNTDYDHARMMLKMQNQSSKLVKCTSAADYISVINTIYNFRVTDDKKVLLTKIHHQSAKWRD